MKKRVLSILLCLCMVLALCPVTALAEEGKTVSFTVTADKTEAQPGETITFTLTMGPVKGFYYADLNLRIPEGLTYVEGSGSITEGLKDKLKAGELVFYESHGNILGLHGCDYTSDANTVLMTFQCTVNDDAATGAKTVGAGLYDDDATNCFDVDMHLIAATFTPATVTVSEAPAPALAITVDGFQVGNTPKDITLSFASTIPDVTFSEDDIVSVDWPYFDGMLHTWVEMGNTEVFEADTRYKIYITMDNKGLKEAPAVTVNGNTPESCRIATRDGVPIQLQILYEFGTPAPAITINGPDVVCAQQDYEFTVTPADGVLVQPEFQYSYDGFLTYDSGLLNRLDGVIPAEKYDSNQGSFELCVHGERADETTVSATKTVQVSQDHIYVDGVCGCGAVKTYTVEYIGSGDDPICRDIKTYGQDLTLRGETFTMDGYVQTGWVDKETGAVYNLGDTYTENADVTLNPVFEKIITLTVPYTTTVALGDVGVPGEKTFTLALIGDSAPNADKSNVTVSGSVTTNGKGSYNGTLTITGPEETLWVMLSEGAFVQQVDDGKAGWTVDDTVWGLLMDEIPVAYAMGDDAVASKYTVYVVPASIDGNGDYTIDWENVQTADMTFTNTYTDHVYEQKHDATHHWDECACKDVQNKELHKYGDWKVTKEATQTAKGEKEHTCTVCGYTEKVEIPKRTTVDTGDNSSFALWVALFTLSAAAVITTATMSKKKKVK